MSTAASPDTALTNARHALEHTIKQLDQYGANTARVVAEWAGTGSASNTSPGGGTSEHTATERAALAAIDATPDRNVPSFDQLEARWTTACGTLARLHTRSGAALPAATGPLAAGVHARGLLAVLRRHGSLVRPAYLHEIVDTCTELCKIITWTNPLTPEQARKLLFDSAQLAHQAAYCRSCRTPGVTNSARCERCDELLKYHVATGNSDLVADDVFDRYVLAKTRSGELDRPASPEYLKDQPRRIHEPTRYTCPRCGASQQVTGGRPGIVGCVDCGTTMTAA